MKLLSAVFVLMTGAMTSSACAEDCKPVAEARAKTATVPSHTLVISQSLGKIETVHTQNAHYETFQGIWKQLPYDDAEQAACKIGGRAEPPPPNGQNDSEDSSGGQHWSPSNRVRAFRFGS